MSFHSNLGAVLAALDSSKRQALQQIGVRCTANVQLIEPVQSGNMRRSTTSQVVSNDAVAIGVTNDAPYSIYVDQGSSKQKAQHFLEDGIQGCVGQIKGLAEESYHNHMRG
jgi:HK97 gp10 family phage protein